MSAMVIPRPMLEGVRPPSPPLVLFGIVDLLCPNLSSISNRSPTVFQPFVTGRLCPQPLFQSPRTALATAPENPFILQSQAWPPSHTIMVWLREPRRACEARPAVFRAEPSPADTNAAHVDGPETVGGHGFCESGGGGRGHCSAAGWRTKHATSNR